MAGNFFWYELMTSDVDAAARFYATVIGWTTQDFPSPDMHYVVVNANGVGVGGIMTVPPEAAAMGAPPAWMGYIHATDIDKQTESVKAIGGKVHRGPQDIPDVGRFSVVADPQGAMFMLLQPNGPDQPELDPMTPGHVGWCELMATDWQTAFDFYSGQYGWTKGNAVEMGEMGTYQTFMQTRLQGGGMMNRPAHMPMPFWSFYFAVEGIDAAAKRVTDHGGTITFGPMEVPGGQWVVNCQDPQGAHFSLVSNTK